MNRKLSKRLLSAAGALMLVALAADPVAAHVTVNPQEVVGGGFAVLTFRMPNERDDARTKQLSVTLPEDPAFTSVRVKRVPGWDYQFQMVPVDPPIEAGDEVITQVVGSIVWRAIGFRNRVRPTEFVDFDVSLGRLPTSGEIAFPAVQVYDNGEVVRWDDPTEPGQPPPPNPAPVLRIVPPSAAPASGSADTTEVRFAADTATTGDREAGESASPLLVAVAGLLVGAGLAGGLLSLRRRRSPMSP